MLRKSLRILPCRTVLEPSNSAMSAAGALATNCQIHDVEDADAEVMRRSLLSWYDENKRYLPWRCKAKTLEDATERAYAVWVSEVMCQQTQVATVIDYYSRWMERWPTLQSLAAASLEDVNEMWSGLGYYSRGRRLWEGAKKVCDELDGKMPATAADLQKLLPGVGRYTSCAIASISYKEPVGVVDGNVIRLLSRLRAIGAESQLPATMDKFWSLANTVVDPLRPGDCNQAMMELGATVCTPKSPSCSVCPVRSLCQAHEMVKTSQAKSSHVFFNRSPSSKTKGSIKPVDEVASCSLCLPQDQWDVSVGVCNFPRKAKKKAPLLEEFTTAVVMRHVASGEREYLLAKRPEEGLLAGLWEFPCVPDDSSSKARKSRLKRLTEHLHDSCAVDVRGLTSSSLGEVSHTFSHRQHTYRVEYFEVPKQERRGKVESSRHTTVRWVQEVQSMAISTAVRKIMSLVSASAEKPSAVTKGAKRKSTERSSAQGGSKRLKSNTLDGFVTKKEK